MAQASSWMCYPCFAFRSWTSSCRTKTSCGWMCGDTVIGESTLLMLEDLALGNLMDHRTNAMSIG